MKGSKQNEQSLVIDNPQYTISRTENYKAKNTYQTHDIITKFVSLTVEYLSFIGEKIHMKNQEYYKFIIMRGLETIIHVFSLLFYYYHHSLVLEIYFQ